MFGFRRQACWIHRLHIDFGMLLHQVDAGARRLDLAALARGNPDPSTVSSTKIVDGVVHGAILFENGLHYVVNRLKQLGKTVGLPCRLTQYVVTRLRLCFGLAGQEKLVALARDVINLNLNFFSLSPSVTRSVAPLFAPGTQ
jgi:hypothetical protein